MTREVPPIIVDRLVKSYNGTLAVRDLSFVVQPGRVTGFLGPNGAGKTTTMRILVGLTSPTTGRATFGDLAYTDLPHPQRTVGCVLDASFHPARSAAITFVYSLPRRMRVIEGSTGCSTRFGWAMSPGDQSGSTPRACGSGSRWPRQCSASRTI
jgi:Fe-S cluster assembly ATPase SufC